MDCLYLKMEAGSPSESSVTTDQSIRNPDQKNSIFMNTVVRISNRLFCRVVNIVETGSPVAPLSLSLDNWNQLPFCHVVQRSRCLSLLLDNKNLVSCFEKSSKDKPRSKVIARRMLPRRQRAGYYTRHMVTTVKSH